MNAYTCSKALPNGLIVIAHIAAENLEEARACFREAFTYRNFNCTLEAEDVSFQAGILHDEVVGRTL